MVEGMKAWLLKGNKRDSSLLMKLLYVFTVVVLTESPHMINLHTHTHTYTHTHIHTHTQMSRYKTAEI